MLCRSILAFAVLALAGAPLQCVRSHGADVPQRGWVLYDRMCAVCHGRDGAGYAADQAPALSNREFLASASDVYLRSAIARGRTGTTMSAWGSERGGPLSPADVDAIIAFMRTWPRPQRAVLDERPLTGHVDAGTAIYARECVQCHGARGIGGTYERIGGPELLTDATDGYLRYAIRRGRSGTPMLPFGSRLSENGVEDVVALIRSWQPTSPPSGPLAPAHIPPLPLGPVPLNRSGPEPLGFHAGGAPTSVDVVKAQLDRGARMALLDARAPSDYVRDHIRGAVSVPFYDPAPYVAALPRDAWLVCYCSCPHAESGQLAQKLISKGFTKVTVLDEGLGVWRSRKYPTRGGIDP
ncbi:MAG TPA: c-type cytochrome [Polyangiaceae bacterium]|nr:c-type cytochrome [Polyangiaceae bacterium]